MSLINFLKALKEHTNKTIFQRFSYFIAKNDQGNNKVDFTRFVCTTFDLDIEDRTKMLAIYSLIENPELLKSHKEDFLRLFDLNDSELQKLSISDLEKEFIIETQDDAMNVVDESSTSSSSQSQTDVDDAMEVTIAQDDAMNVVAETSSSSSSQSQTDLDDAMEVTVARDDSSADLTLFKQDYKFLRGYSEVTNTLNSINFNITLKNLFDSLENQSRTLKLTELNFFLEKNPKYEKSLAEQISLYRSTISKIIEIYSCKEHDVDFLLSFFNCSSEYLSQYFNGLLDDGIYEDDSLKQQFFRNILSLFYTKFNQLYPNGLPIFEDSEFLFINEMKKNQSLFLVAKYLSHPNNSSPLSLEEQGSAEFQSALRFMAKSGYIDVLIAAKLNINDQNELSNVQNAFRHFTSNTDVYTLTEIAFKRRYLGVFKNLFARLNDEQKLNLLNDLINWRSEQDKKLTISYALMFLFMLSSIKSFSINVSDNLIPDIVETLETTKNLDFMVIKSAFNIINSLPGDYSHHLVNYFNDNYTYYFENRRVSTESELTEFYEDEIKQLFTELLPIILEKGLLKRLSIKISDCIRYTNLLLQELFNFDTVSQLSNSKIELLIKRLILKIADLDSTDLTLPYKKSEHVKNLSFLLTGRSNEDVINIAEKVIGGLSNNYQKYCAYNLFVTFMLKHPAFREFKSDLLSSFIHASCQSILSKSCEFDFLRKIGASQIASTLNGAQLDIATNPFLLPHFKGNADKRIEYAMSFSILISNTHQVDKKILISNQLELILQDDAFMKKPSEIKIHWANNFNFSCLATEGNIAVNLIRQIFECEFDKAPCMKDAILGVASLSVTCDEIKNQVLNSLEKFKQNTFFINSCQTAILELNRVDKPISNVDEIKKLIRSLVETTPIRRKLNFDLT